MARKTIVRLCVMFTCLFILTTASAWPTDVYGMWNYSKSIVTKILCLMLLFAPGVVLMMLALGAIMILVYADNPDRRNAGKKLIINAILGSLFVIALIAVANTNTSTLDLNLGVTYDRCKSLSDKGPDTTSPTGSKISPSFGGTIVG